METSERTRQGPLASNFVEDVRGALGPLAVEEALREGPRRFFVLAAEIARRQVDPAADWVGFVQALWEQVDAGFGLTPDEAVDGEVPRGWFDHPEDPPVVAWEERGRGPSAASAGG